MVVGRKSRGEASKENGKSSEVIKEKRAIGRPRASTSSALASASTSKEKGPAKPKQSSNEGKKKKKRKEEERYEVSIGYNLFEVEPLTIHSIYRLKRFLITRSKATENSSWSVGRATTPAMIVGKAPTASLVQHFWPNTMRRYVSNESWMFALYTIVFLHRRIPMRCNL